MLPSEARQEPSRRSERRFVRNASLSASDGLPREPGKNMLSYRGVQDLCLAELYAKRLLRRTL